ncbi:nitroreductase family protein [Anaerorhabdus sp.]|uniref:nitroreductase family protein n=1 Tax=Anaerorhabdus sp. TaxID=1872524 RepID=UPI002FCC8406
MNNITDVLLSRSSLRKFSSTPITSEDMDEIIKCAKQAPSAGNMQMYTIINITDPQLKEKLSVTCDNQPFIKDASHILVFCNDMSKWERAFNLYGAKQPGDKSIDEADFILSMQDAVIAAQNAVVAAESMGIGSCYIGDIMENYEIHQELLHLPKYVFPCCMLVLGYFPDAPIIAPHKRYDNQYIVCDNTYKELSDEQIEAMFSIGSQDETKAWMKRFYDRKINSDFFKEMGRSLHAAMNDWKK